MKDKRLSPLKAIRSYCLWCTINQPIEIRLCPSGDCPIHDFRLGLKPKYQTNQTPLKAIRAKCIDCSGFELGRVSGCNFDGKKEEKCYLFDFRLGKNKARSGIGNKNIGQLNKKKK